MEICDVMTFIILFLLLQLFFRYAEKIFWAIEGYRAPTEDDRQECLRKSSAPRSIEFYFFLKGFLHTIPQILLQLHILMRNVKLLDQQTSKYFREFSVDLIN